MEYQRLLLNSIQTPDGTILTSTHRHDYQCHRDKNGLLYATDGGGDYQRTIINPEAPHINLSVWDDGSHELRVKYLKWGSNYDKDMNRLPETIYKTIEEMDTDHILAIIEGNYCKSEYYYKIFKQELINRENR